MMTSATGGITDATMPKSPAPPPTEEKRPARVYSAPALEKAIDIIELLSTEPAGLTITEVATRLSRSISELFRIMVVLDRRGWLRKDPASDRYRATYKLLETAHRATPAQELTHIAAPLMRRLSEVAMQSCHLVVVNGDRGLILLRQESPGPAGFAVRVGTGIELLDSCSGHVLLAFMVEHNRAVLLDRLVPAKARAAIDTMLGKVRADGFQRVDSTRMAGVTDISWPIFGYDGQIVAALTIPFLEVLDQTPHLSETEAIDALRETTARISDGLGWSERGGTDRP